MLGLGRYLRDPVGFALPITFSLAPVLRICVQKRSLTNGRLTVELTLRTSYGRSGALAGERSDLRFAGRRQTMRGQYEKRSRRF